MFDILSVSSVEIYKSNCFAFSRQIINNYLKFLYFAYKWSIYLFI